MTLDDIERIVRKGQRGKMRDAFLRAIKIARGESQEGNLPAIHRAPTTTTTPAHD